MKTNARAALCGIELLELRIAPASAFATYIDFDGDLVKITASTPGAQPLSFAGKLSFVGGGTEGQLARLDVTDPSFMRANITFTVSKATTGDGLAHVGEIAALGVDLGAVTIKGDLGAIDVGNLGGPALKSLTALSIGAFGTATGGILNGDGTLESTIRGGVGTLKVKGDVTGAWINVSEASGGDGSGNIATLLIGGSLVGGGTLRSGSVKTVGDLGSVKIGHDLLGAAGNESGKIDAGGKIKSLSIGGSIKGGSGNYNTSADGNFILHSGQVFAVGDIGAIKITRDVVAGKGAFAAAIHSHGALGGSVTIGGSIFLSLGLTFVNLIGDAEIGAVKIGRSAQALITSGGALSSLTIGGSAVGVFTSAGAMGLVKVGGEFTVSIEAGTTLGAVIVNGSLENSIRSGGQMGLIKVGGDLGARLESGAGITAVMVGGTARGSIVSAGQIGKIDARGGAELPELTATAGGLGELNIRGSLSVNTFNIQGALGRLKAGALGGNFLVGGGVGAMQVARDFTAIFNVSGELTSLAIGGTLTGIVQASELPSITIKGAVMGQFAAPSIGTVKIGGDLRGPISGGEIRSVTIGGSVIYQHAFDGGGAIFATGRLGALKISGDVQGPGIRPGEAPGSTVRGMFEAGSIGTITIGGSLRAGTDESNVASFDLFPLILSYHEIASVTIGGDLRGTVGSAGDIVSASIVALNQSAGLTTNLAIGKVTIGGSVERANIFAGTGPGTFSAGTNGNASIGAVKVGGNWVASNLVAGVKDTNGDGFGNADDEVPNMPAGAQTDAILARIASISIGGAVAGTPSGATRFGFVAQEIGSLKIGSRAFLLNPGSSNDDFNLSLTRDTQLREV